MKFRNIVASAFCVCLAACGARETRQPPFKSSGPELPRPAAGAGAYSIDSAQSELRLLVYRAGPMARLGHNHVILNRSIGGWVDATAHPESGSFSLYVPASAFIIDDARARSEEGPDFSGDVPEEAKSGTRHNMLGGDLLDAELFPVITLTSAAITQGSDGGFTARLTVAVAGRESTIDVPFVLETSVDRISASGQVVLRQSDLGLTPFSVMLGALQVKDDFTVKFRFVAVAAHT